MFGLDPWIFVFSASAESQHYRPRYAIHTGIAPQASMQSNAPAAQLAGAMGLGFAPTLDSDTDGITPPGTKRCL